MDRNNFFKPRGAFALPSTIGNKLKCFVPAHVWDEYDFGVAFFLTT